MATNEILPFCGTDTGTNLLTQAEYDADTQRPIGNQPGVARTKLVNKTLRQTSTVAAGLAQYVANRQGTDVTDSLTPTALEAMIAAAVAAQIDGTSRLPNVAYFTASGTWNVPAGVTAVRATIRGGGGGAGNAIVNTPVQAGDGGASSVAHTSGTTEAEGGEGGWNYNSTGVASPAHGGGTDADFVQIGSGASGGVTNANGNNSATNGANGGLAIKEFTVSPADTLTITVGAGGVATVSSPPAADGASGSVILEW